MGPYILLYAGPTWTKFLDLEFMFLLAEFAKKFVFDLKMHVYVLKYQINFQSCISFNLDRKSEWQAKSRICLIMLCVDYLWTRLFDFGFAPQY